MTKHLDKNALNVSVFEPLCSGFNDSSAALRELTLKATLALVPSLNSPNVEKLSRYLVRLQSDAETSIRANAVIFIAKIAPHLSEVSKQKMLLPAFARSMKDTFAPCRLSALQSTLQTKTLFTMQDIATKVLPCVMPLLLDPMPDVRKEAFRVVQNLLKDLEEESKRMEKLGVPGQGPSGAPSSGNMPQQAAAQVANGTAPAPVSGGSSYLSGLSSWMTSSASAATQPSGTMSAGTTPTKPSAPVAPTTAPPSITNVRSPQPTLPVQQQFGSPGFSVSAPAPAAPAVDDGWGDDGDDDDGWGDDVDEIDADPFANIGAKPTSIATSFTKAPVSAGPTMGGTNDDPFASVGMKTVAAKPKPSGGKLILPKKTNLAAKKIAAPPATKLAIDDDDDIADGWDDF
mmetsp:Transcript_12638/g.22717  ORF Transcript_12638/g.22717 Transcript_12638/m.22717 type:complete len:401 (-) Transcript_12638:51-1253(-)